MSKNVNDQMITVFDTTLRDGEQSPGATMNLDEKLRIATVLDEMGVDVIEAGFARSSPGDFEAIQAVAGIAKQAAVCSLARADRADIDAAAEAIAKAGRKRIHTFISTSPIHMKYKLQLSPEEVPAAVSDSVGYARKYVDDVQWGVEDATRSDPDFLARCCEAAIKAGASTIDIADTVGYIQPLEFDALLEDLLERVPGMDEICISVHCHDDLGMATANSLSAIKAGARQVDCTINGLGERAGNASLEEIVMNLRTRADFFDYDTRIKAELLTKASQLVSAITGFVVPPNKAIVGSNAFAHEAGIHQHGVIQHRATYEIMTAESVGAAGTQLVLGKHSGRHAFRRKLEELGLGLGENAMQTAFDHFKTLSDQKKHVVDDDIIAIVSRTTAVQKDFHGLKNMTTSSEPDGTAKVNMTVLADDSEIALQSDGDTVYRAVFDAFAQRFGDLGSIEYIRLNAMGDHDHPQSRVTLRVQRDGKPWTVQGSDADPNIAFARAVLQLVNRIDENLADDTTRSVL